MSQCDINMNREHSISEVARIVGVNRRTLQRWIVKKQIPSPKVEIVGGKLWKSWTASEVAQIKDHKSATYRGKGINRRTGKKTKGTEGERDAPVLSTPTRP
jgi:excisionase family DNA binding protein